MKILKAEILLVRDRCNLNCTYCSIVNPSKKTASESIWKQTLDTLKDLGCVITPIYGSEPTLEFETLKSFLKYSQEIGLLNTVITNCTSLNESKLDELIESGLDSLTVSVDTLIGKETDSSTSIRTKASLLALEYCKNKIKDLEVSVTLNKYNLAELPYMVGYFTSKNIWVSFDFIHWCRNKWSKCPTIDKVKNLIATDYTKVKRVFSKILDMKKDGYLVHQSEEVIKMILNNTEQAIKLSWRCSSNHPSFVTIDADGMVLPCDDLAISSGIKAYELADKWDEFVQWRKNLLSSVSCSCFWTTHIDAEHYINQDYKNYIHYR